MEHWIKRILQKVLGFDNYLFVFSIFSIYRLRCGLLERGFLQFVKLIPDNGIILDLGANIGIMTTYMATYRSNAKVFSFEPIPQNIATLKRIIKLFDLKNVEIFGVALGDSNGEVRMVMPVINDVRMQGLCHVANDTTGVDDGMLYSVPLKRLDDMPELNTIGMKISAIKIDVENFEYCVLSGAKNLLTRHRPVIYSELWENEVRTKTISMLSDIGYEVRIAEGDKLVPYTSQKGINFVFLPKQN